MRVNEPVSSLESARVLIERADVEVDELLGRSASQLDTSALAEALDARAGLWRAVARLSFDDVVAGDLLGRAARKAACHDEQLASQYRDAARR